MQVMAIALGGCLKGEPAYGITEDTGGHITYILGSMRALAETAQVTRAEIVTRLFDAPDLGKIHAQKHEQLSDNLTITRIDSGDSRYLSKECLARDVPAFTAALIAELRKRDRLPDLIYAHFADAAKVAGAVRDKLKIPFIYTAHSLAIDKVDAMKGECTGLRARIDEETAAIANADAIIGSSRDECERQLMSYPTACETRIHRVRPGIDQRQATDHDIASAQELIAPFLRHPDRPIVLAIARPVEKKNLVSLVRAFANSDKLRHSANLVILPGLRQSMEHGEVGQVAVLRKLFDAIDGNDLHGSVAYPRKHTAAQVRGLYALAAKSGGIFVNPAMTEPFGLTILEAAVHGLPVVATKHGGPADIIDEIQHGMVIDPHNSSELSEAIERFLSDYPQWQSASQNARNNIGAVTWEAYAAGFVGVANEVLHPKTAPIARAVPDKLLLCDIDNTLTGCRHAAIRFAEFVSRRSDVAFGIATGRSLIEARRLVREWNLPKPVVWVTSVGSEIYWDGPNGLEADIQYQAQIDRNWDASAIGDALTPVSDIKLQTGVDQRAFKRSFFTLEKQAATRVRQTLSDHGLAAKVIHSHDRLLDILPARAGKGAAMRHVAKRLGIGRDAVFVAGDSGNDLDMLEAAANAIVVANCEPVLHKLRGSPSVYFAERRFAAGALEGVLAMMDRRDKAMSHIALQDYAA